MPHPASRRPSPVAALAGLAAAALLGGACAPEPPEPPKRVFLITVDTLRADHLGFAGYPRDTSPALDELAARSVVFDRAIAQWPKTGPSFASVFSGRYPQTTGITHEARVKLPGDLVTLPELLQEHGFRTVAVVSNAVLAADRDWDQGFDEYLETWKAGPRPDGRREWKRAFSAPRVNRLAEPLLERHADAEKLFVWLHYSDPHTPTFLLEWERNPFIGDPWYTGKERIGDWFPRPALLGKRRELRYYVAQYDVNVLYSDTYIGAILDRAGELGLLDDALVVFTSDHGEALGEHDHYGHGPLPYNDAARVPLFLHRPGAVAEGRRVDRPVELVDLYPTLRDLIAPGAVVDGLEGESLAGFLAPGRPPRGFDPAAFRFAFSEAGDRKPPHVYYRSVQDERFKLIFHPPIERKEMPSRVELYDLTVDPLETRDLADELDAESRRLGSVLAKWMKAGEGPHDGAPAEEPLDEETLEALRALGYVE